MPKVNEDTDVKNTNSVSAIFVTYNSESIISDSVEKIIEIDEISKCYIVDNGSSDKTIEIIQNIKSDKIELIKNNDNLGFGVANNIALEKVKTPYALCINPDAILEKKSLKNLISKFSMYSNAAVISPILTYEDGTIQESYKRNVFDREKNKYKFIIPDGDICADFLSGAVLLFEMEKLNKVGFFDPNIFLFYEDDDLCLRIKEAGYSLILSTSSKAIHLFGKSSPDTANHRKFKHKHMTKSRLYIEKKYRGYNSAKKLSYKFFLLYGIKAILYAIILKNKKREIYYARFESAKCFIKQSINTN